jgi:cystathionine beta-synthase
MVFLATLFSQAGLGWLLRRIPDWGGWIGGTIGTALVWFMQLEPATQVVIITALQGNWQTITLGSLGGLAAWAALQVAAEYPEDATIVVLLPDTGRNYLSKIFNDDWMAANGFLDRTGAAARVGDVLALRPGELPAIVHVHPDESVRDAIATLHEFGVSQMPVVKREQLEARDDVLGSIRERSLLDRAYQDPEVLGSTVGDVMDGPLPMVDRRDTVEQVMGVLTTQSPAVLVCDGPVPVGVLTRADILDFLAAGLRT